MALTDLTKDFRAKAAAAGLAAMVAFAPAAWAGEAPANNAPAGEIQVAATQEVQGWKAAEQARDYGRTGNVGILIYRGNDTGNYTGEQIARGFEAAFAKKNVTAKAFYDEARSGGTSISFALGKDAWGPFNVSEAVANIDMISGEFKVRQLLRSQEESDQPQLAQQ